MMHKLLFFFIESIELRPFFYIVIATLSIYSIAIRPHSLLGDEKFSSPIIKADISR